MHPLLASRAAVSRSLARRGRDGWIALLVTAVILGGAACGPADAATTDEPPAADVVSSTSSGETAPAGTPPKPAAPVDLLALRPAYTEHLGQLTTTALSPPPPGMVGTDLGASFARDGKAIFLFGDTASADPALRDVDFAATAPLAMPASGLPPLTWLGRLAPPGIALGPMNVPVEGVANGDDTYVFFAAGFEATTGVYSRSVLAKTRATAFDALTVVHDEPAGDFANVSVIVEDDEAFVFGSSGRYRQSGIRLARVPVAQLGDRAAWKVDPKPVVPADCVGELSARKHPTLPLYLLAYNCESPRGVWLHLAKSPAGPWREAGKLFDPKDGYGRFIHAKESTVGHDDGLAEPAREEDWGGEYGPYFVPSWFSRDGNALGLVYVLSSWNPYQVHLVRTWLAPEGKAPRRLARGAGLPKATLSEGAWVSTGDAFVTFVGSDGKERLTTYTSKGDAAVGTRAQTFVVDAATHELTFWIHGGDGRVVLLRDGDVVRSSRGLRTLASSERLVHWNLEEYQGETLRLVIEDDLTGPWGYVGVRDFVLQ